MAEHGKLVGATIGGVVGAATGSGIGIVTAGVGIPATVPFALGGAGLGYAGGDLVEDLGQQALANQKKLLNAGGKIIYKVKDDAQKTFQKFSKGLGKPYKTLKKLRKWW